MQNGIIDLRHYLSNRSYALIIKNFYLHKTLITYHFDEFKHLQLNTPYGKKSYYEKIELLVDQGFLKVSNIDELNAIPIAKLNEDNYFQITDCLNTEYKKYQYLKENANCPESHLKASNAHFELMAIEERLFALLHKEKYNEEVIPVSSLASYDTLELSLPKTNVYRVLINNFPIPDETVPLHDIIQYRDEESNRLNFLRLRKWARNISEKNLSEKEIAQEVEYLIAEFNHEMELAGMKYKTSKFEFILKIIPTTLENAVMLNLNKLIAPLFELRKQKISLLEVENNAKGNELAYIIRA